MFQSKFPFKDNKVLFYFLLCIIISLVILVHFGQVFLFLVMFMQINQHIQFILVFVVINWTHNTQTKDRVQVNAPLAALCKQYKN